MPTLFDRSVWNMHNYAVNIIIEHPYLKNLISILCPESNERQMWMQCWITSGKQKRLWKCVKIDLKLNSIFWFTARICLILRIFICFSTVLNMYSCVKKRKPCLTSTQHKHSAWSNLCPLPSMLVTSAGVGKATISILIIESWEILGRPASRDYSYTPT